MTSTRLPGKVMMTVGGIPIVKRVWMAAKGSVADKVVVAWPERYPDLDENDVLERFRRISNEFPSKYIIRLTSDCPLLTSSIINEACREFERSGRVYYSNRNNYPDGFDVQIFSHYLLHHDFATNKEHVITPEKHKTATKFLSVDTAADLAKVRKYAR